MDKISLYEWLGLGVDALVPLVIAIIAILGKRYVDSLERRRFAYEMGITWRTETFRELATNLNLLTKFHCYVGDWRILSPGDARDAKRRCDELVFANGFLWSDEFLRVWQRFNDEAFVENRGPSSSFLLRANVDRYRELASWKDEYVDFFVPSSDRIRRSTFRPLVDDVLKRAAQEVGIVR
ncbi:hypothetical protein ACERZ8_00905 [Tateyamaria armeniaca]|uniref:Uncharacterized protein n=1 Tax=Tateyamaria armeniaca TaxID=2518930 RepID=A0ABW8UTI0_9RHOB